MTECDPKATTCTDRDFRSAKTGRLEFPRPLDAATIVKCPRCEGSSWD